MEFLQECPPAGPSLLTSRPLLCLVPLSQQPQLYLLIPGFYTHNHLILVYNMMSCRAPHLIGSSVSHAIKILSKSSQILLDILCKAMLKKRVCSLQFIWSSTFSSAPRDDVRGPELDTRSWDQVWGWDLGQPWALGSVVSTQAQLRCVGPAVGAWGEPWALAPGVRVAPLRRQSVDRETHPRCSCACRNLFTSKHRGLGKITGMNSELPEMGKSRIRIILGLDLMISWGPFQPLQCCDSVIMSEDLLQMALRMWYRSKQRCLSLKTVTFRVNAEQRYYIVWTDYCLGMLLQFTVWDFYVRWMARYFFSLRMKTSVRCQASWSLVVQHRKDCYF